MADTFGVMDQGYFVSRTDILSWLNEALQLNLTKIEQCGTGAAYCQVIDVLNPGRVRMERVNWNAKSEYEYINNYKVLQDAFQKCGIQKHIEVEKLSKCKYQDNLEFCQWLKRYFDMHYSGAEYDALSRRGGSGGPAVSSVPSQLHRGGQRPPPKPAPAMKSAGRMSGLASRGGGFGRGGASDAKVQGLQDQVAELKVTVDGLERERDFYFGKLRDVEILCQTWPDQELDIIQQIFNVLYATDEEGAEAEDEPPQP